jgi:hypothetical protein
MTIDHADYHAQCGSYVRISVEDLNGPFGHALEEIEHPASAVYPGVYVGACELAAGHPGQCEMYVEGRQPTATEKGGGYWIVWQRPPDSKTLPTKYAWVAQPDYCEVTSPYGWSCSRPAAHDGGHTFTAENC